MSSSFSLAVSYREIFLARKSFAEVLMGKHMYTHSMQLQVLIINSTYVQCVGFMGIQIQTSQICQANLDSFKYLKMTYNYWLMNTY